MSVYLHALRQSLVTLVLLGASGVQADVRMRSVSPEETERAVRQVLERLPYKKCHWQVAGHTFYQLHLLFDSWAVSASRWRTTSLSGPSFRDHQRDARPYRSRYRAFCSHIRSY